MQGEVHRSQLSLEGTESGFRAAYRFDRELPIFEGHFPGSPLVPGVFLIEALRQATGQQLGRKLVVAEVGDARFTAPLGPGETVEIEARLQAEPPGEGSAGWTVKAILSRGELPAAKLRLRLVESAS